MKSEPTHECQRCRKPEALLSFAFCGACRQQLNDEGLCARCGAKPRKPRHGKLKQSRYCVECQAHIGGNMKRYATERRTVEREESIGNAVRQGINIRDHNLVDRPPSA